jgi:hypothetical protein
MVSGTNICWKKGEIIIDSRELKSDKRDFEAVTSEGHKYNTKSTQNV